MGWQDAGGGGLQLGRRKGGRSWNRKQTGYATLVEGSWSRGDSSGEARYRYIYIYVCVIVVTFEDNL